MKRKIIERRKKTVERKKKDATQSKRLNSKIYLTILSIIVIVIYAQTTNFDFVSIDDNNLILENPIVTDPSVSYAEAFVKNIYSVHYKPLVFTSWKAEYKVFGASPWHFHLINWLLHLANTIILFFLGIKLFEKLYKDKKIVYLSAFLLALFFTINPLRIESVAWATERKDVLFSFFFLLSWFLYIRYIQNKKYLYLAIGAVLYLFSGLSKSMGLTLVMVLFLSDYWFQRKFTIKVVLEKIPYIFAFILLSFFYGLLNFGSSAAILPVVESAPEVSNQITSLEYINDLPTSIQWIVTTSLRFWLWIIHSLVPFKLSVIYSHDTVIRFWGKSIFLFPMLVAGLYFFIWKRRQKNMALLGGLLFYGITLSPALALSSSGQAIFLSDRYTYIPSIGLFFIMVVLLNKLNYQKRNFKILCSLIFLLYFSITMTNIGYWKNSESLFSRSVEVSPDSGLAYLSLGRLYREQNKLNKAIQVYNNGIVKAPSYYQLYSYRGKIYFDQGKNDLALIDFNKCLSLKADFAPALANRGAIFGQRQDYKKALIDLNKALDISPNYRNALSNRGYIYYYTEQYDKTIEDYKKIVSNDPNSPKIINTIGLAYNKLKEYDLAISEFTRSISLDPSQGAYYNNRSYAHFHKGDKQEALKDALKAQQLGFNVKSSYLNSLK